MLAAGVLCLVLFSISVHADNSLSSTSNQFTKDRPGYHVSTVYRYQQTQKGIRDLIEFRCHSDHTLSIENLSQARNVDTWKMHQVGDQGGCRKYYADHFPAQRLTVFDELDFEMVQNLNNSFYADLQTTGTLTFQHGHPTEKVYVFVPGLYMSAKYFLYSGIRKFTEGNNVIIATLPGHEGSGMPTDENNVALWSAYAEYIGVMARQYGKKVIFVGQSMGGNISVHAAEKGHADELILIQPFLGLSRSVKASLAFAEILPEPTLKKIPIEPAPSRYSNLFEVAKAGEQARLMLSVPYSKLNTKIPVHIYVDRADGVVSVAAIAKWVSQFAPQSTLEFHANGHMYNPLK